MAFSQIASDSQKRIQELIDSTVVEVKGPELVSDPLVSVWLLTFNHKRFIRQAIESVLGQECEFPFEIVIGDDCSTDGTTEIVREYQRNHPGKIRLLLAKRNLWNATPGILGTIMALALYQACRGRYVALLEGDDYWTAPSKLQKQFNFLEAHAECSACFHRTQIVDDKGNPQRPFPLTTVKSVYNVEDVIRAMPAHTSSLMLRREVIENLPAWFPERRSGDWTIQITAASLGGIGFIDETMSAYRVHKGGSWTAGNSPQSPPAAADLDRLAEILKFYDTVNKHFDYRYDGMIRRQVSTWTYDLAWAHQRLEHWPEMREQFWKAFKACPLNTNMSFGTIFRFFLVAHFPALYRLFRRMKKSLERSDRQ
jgi:glycosyltransferase involved in cell wall biosynthesis